MRLNTRTDYALRLLLYLQSSGARPASVREIAAAYAISPEHLTKVARELTLRGWIETRRGRHGGLGAESTRLGTRRKRSSASQAVA